jgi:EAL domain-containing protein (putative c-di-GMP-specific phosphodiesterase class I)
MERLVLLDELRAAIASRDLRVVYQPVVTTATGRIAGVEALVRWTLDGVEVPADVFVRLAEDTGLVDSLGQLVLETVAHDAPTLRSAAGGPISISVNVSARQLQEPVFLSAVEQAVQAMGRTGLVLEITERQEIGDAATLEAMRVISELGVRFAVDDFGVGFSSISYLRDLPVHVVKTDAALSQHIDTDERARAVLRAVTVMAEALGLDVVVEGIEREGQLAAVRDEVGALLVQGYLLYRPMPIAALLSVVRANRRGDQPLSEPDESLAPIAR